MARTNAPISSFGAELQAVLRRGAERELRIKFDSPALATRFAQRINALRSAMKRANHPDWEQLYRCGVHKDERDPRVLVLAPKDSEFRAALLAAGIDTLPPPETLAVEIATPAPGSAPDAADDFLATLREETTIPTIKKDSE